jgi:phosphoribosylglycinamide formyltransferase-1
MVDEKNEARAVDFDGVARERYSHMAKVKLGILVSGSGTNLQAILDAVKTGAIDAEVGVVISNQSGVKAIERAESAGVPVRVIAHRDFADRAAFDAALVTALREAGAEYVVLAGFMRVLTPVFLDAFPWRVVNIHPALLPAFPGVHAQRQALAYGVKVAGCTVHFVDSGTDTGPIIAQAVVPVLDTDDEATLGARILREEHRLLVATLAAVAQGEVEVVPGEGTARPRVRLGERAVQRFAGDRR